MKKGLFLLSLIVTFYALGTVSASAVTNDTVKVGLLLRHVLRQPGKR